MAIFERMQKLTAGKTEKEKAVVPGDILSGVITAIPKDKKTGKPKGFFFISSVDLPFERIFAHWSGLKQETLRFPELRKRMKVEFQLQHDETNGYRAIKISVVK